MMEPEDIYRKMDMDFREFMERLFVPEEGRDDMEELPIGEGYVTGEMEWHCPDCYTKQTGMVAHKKENIRRKCRRCKTWFKEGKKGLEPCERH